MNLWVLTYGPGQVLELISSREPVAVLEAGALEAAFGFITNGGGMVYRDALLSAMNVISRCCARLDPSAPSVPTTVQQLALLLQSDDAQVGPPVPSRCSSCNARESLYSVAFTPVPCIFTLVRV